MKNTHTDTPIDKIFTGIITSQAKLYNNTYSFLSLLDGEVTISMNGQTVNGSRNTVFFLPPGAHIELGTEDSAIFFILCFDYLFTEDYLGYHAYEKIAPGSLLLRQDSDSPLIQQLAAVASVCLDESNSSPLALDACVLSFFHYLKFHYIEETQASRPDHLSERQYSQLLKMKSYIHAHYTQPIALSDLASQFGMTPQYTATFFKNAAGETVFEYLARIRLNKAADYIVYSEETPFYIAAATGFPNLNAFIKAFTGRYDMTPEQWRQSHPKPEFEVTSGNIFWFRPDNLAKDYIDNYVPLRGVSSIPHNDRGYEKHYNIPVTQGDFFHLPWTFLINLGYIQGFSHGDYRRQLASVQNIIHFTYGRILRPFDIITPITVDGQQLYDFSKIFRVLDFLKQIQLLPFIELGNKRSKINIGAWDRIDLKVREDSADYYENLFKILPAFLCQCINRYGMDYVGQWYFELWTEHSDLDSDLVAPSVYAQYFSRVYHIIKRIIPQCRVGGPGYNTYAPLSHFEQIMTTVAGQGCSPDFISAYIYPYVLEDREEISGPKSDTPILSPDPDIYKRRLLKVHDFCQIHYPEIPDLIITEYACEVSSRNFINDSIYQATFIAKFNLDGFSLAHGFGYWLLSDISLEYRDSNQILFGGNGLVNRNGIYKPGFHTFRFLTGLGNRMIASGPEYIMTRLGNGQLSLLVYNYAHLREDFCQNNTSYASLKNPTAVFFPMEPRDIIFTLEKLPPGNWRIRHYTINNDHGNLLNEWIRLGAPENLSRSDIDYLQAVSWPYQEMYYKETEGTLEISCHLAPQEVGLYIIEHII